MSGIRIAMWSGPRNVSTALMRSWDSRKDTFVCDEPLYAHYLRVTGLNHPGREEIMAAHEVDWCKVVEWLTGDVPEGKAIFYQKHMAHHLLPNIERQWIEELTNVFLIRRPREMLVSLARIIPNVTFDDTGLLQQWEVFDMVRRHTGVAPPVIDARDVLENPRGTLTALCLAVGVPFDESMLSWAAGPRQTDGVWAKHWYAAVEESTGFAPYRPRNEPLPESLEETLAQCQTYYERLYEHRLVTGGDSN